MYNRPDKPLIVKCTFDRWNKRITFNSARNCTYSLLRHKVEQCFSLSASAYAIAYKDDDGEITDITTDDDLTEAIQYFHAGADDAPLSSAASILSGRSFGSRKITLRVQISVDYDGPSLSDTGSLASLDEYQNRNGSQMSFSLGAPSVVPDDDSVTVSSRDTMGTSARGSLMPPNERASQLSGESSWDALSRSTNRSYSRSTGNTPSTSKSSDRSNDPFSGAYKEHVSIRYPDDPSAVFERLKIEEALQDDSSSIDYDPIAGDDRGAAWLKDQNERAIRSKLGVLPEPSISNGASDMFENEDQLGDLALERDPRGKYYYSYTIGSSSASQTHDDVGFEPDLSIDEGVNGKLRPTSRHLNWLAAQQIAVNEPRPQKPALQTHHSDPSLDTIIPPELLQYIPIPPPGLENLTDCSECGTVLDSMKYVCSTCGEKEPGLSFDLNKGKFKDSTGSAITYPPRPRNYVYTSGSSPSFSSSSQTFVGSSDSAYSSKGYRPLPSLPNLNESSSSSTLTVPGPKRKETGYELCPNCLESAGVTHAIEAGIAPGSSPTVNSSPSSPDDAQRALQWRRAAPKQKGQLRHAYLEKMWGHGGWEDVEQDDSTTANCSACGVITPLRKAYKCASCLKHYLCRACYSQVHDLHPSHAFLMVPDKLVRAQSDPEFLSRDPPEEQSMVHPGVKCAHCLLDIVGARFHCAICDSVDICSNCESAGLPGNLDSDDVGHNSSHILIKIPYPLESNEVQTVSRKAIHLWTRDPANVNRSGPRSKANSEISSYARTVVGSRGAHPLEQQEDEHGILCNGCSQPIMGVRYQCANCPSSTLGYNLCARCEERSYVLHDPHHAFFKLPRPVNRPLESPYPMIPILYKTPAGPRPAAYNDSKPAEYLESLVHSSAVCDRCMTCIPGAWFRCAYCGLDLCDSCEAMDTHNDRHVFIVFKSTIDMQALKVVAELDNPGGSPPVIPYPVYC